MNSCRFLLPALIPIVTSSAFAQTGDAPAAATPAPAVAPAPPPAAGATSSGSISLGASSKGASDAATTSTTAASTSADSAVASTGANVDAVPPPVESPSYMSRYLPQPGLFEIGLFGGAMFPSNNLALELSDRPHREFKDLSGELGLRLAYYPLDFLGIEAEGAAIPSRVEGGRGAGLWAARGHLIGQLTSASITPFLLVGAGALGANSHEMGGVGNFAIHFGAGVKVPFDDFLSMRLDVRDTLSKVTSQSDATVAHSPEILLGLTLTLDRNKPAPPAPPPAVDTDADGIPDNADKCPTQIGVAPDGCPPDTDKDGVADITDQCPNEAGPAPTGCPPPKDTDNDGVVDTADACPTQAGTLANGCPDPDPDHDGVTVEHDKCPQQPETVNGYQDEDGCPDELPEAVKRFTGTIQGIEFDFGKATIRRGSHALLDKAAETLASYPELKLLVLGHTDNVGTRERNIELSRKRAEAVKAYLVSKNIDESRIKADGAGPDRPLTDENTPEARAKNRRIEFHILTR